MIKDCIVSIGASPKHAWRTSHGLLVDEFSQQLPVERIQAGFQSGEGFDTVEDALPGLVGPKVPTCLYSSITALCYESSLRGFYGLFGELWSISTGSIL